MILGPTGLFAATDWGTQGDEQPGAHGFSRDPVRVHLGLGQQRLRLRGLGDTYGFNDNPTPGARTARTGTSPAAW